MTAMRLRPPSVLRVLNTWLRDRGGAAAVEMALVAPLLAAVLVGIANYAPELQTVHRMRDAVSTGALYVMTGGTDPTAIQTVTSNAWTGHGQSDQITVTQWCACAGVTGSCNSLCPDSTVPQGFTRINASTTYVGPLGSQSLGADQTIRTR
jgi:Flp pilus assembly protein TadG